MSYTPTTWNSGDVVTSAKLNNIETGISNATPLIIAFNEDTGTCDHTWQEIHDALAAGQMVLWPSSEDNNVSLYIIGAAEYSHNEYSITMYNADSPFAAVASADGYPVAVG